MTIEVKVPVLPESVADATIVTWHKKAGDTVARDENLVDLETDKVVLEVPAPSAGVLAEIKKTDGSTVVSDEILAVIDTDAKVEVAAPKQESKVEVVSSPEIKSPENRTGNGAAAAGPAARRLATEKGIDISTVSGTDKGGRVSKADVMQASQSGGAKVVPMMAIPGERPEQRVPMTRLRARIAERLVSAQHEAAMLTTFNEINLQAVMDLRAKYKDKFEKEHGVKIGFMSFFTRAAIEALKRFPEVNASIDGNDVVYHGYYDVGIAVSTERGLVVPVLRDADRMSMADIEATISDCAVRARDNKLTMEEMTGGTFTITNGGIFGSLLSTPILNPPQVAILGMHKIEQRAVVENGEVVVRPMMYVALTYDHRIIDGKGSVQFLLTIKELLEDPARLLLQI